MKKRWLLYVCSALLLFVVIYGCSKDNTTNNNGGGDNADFKVAMLTNYADTLIIPAYENLQTNLGLLETAINAFLTSPSIPTQQALLPVFKNAYISFEGVSFSYFGPAMALSMNNYANTFPTQTNSIENNIAAGTWSFTIPTASDTIQGFPALDYLLFSSDAIQKFSDVNASDRKKYVQDIVARLRSLTDGVVTQWKGAYHSTFVNSTQTNVGSSIGYLVNYFAFEMDMLKGPRIGWPFGKQSGGVLYADKCEGYYSAITKDLAVANLESLKKYFTGGNGNGIADYLVILNRQQLAADVLTQFDVAINAIKAISSPMSNAFATDASTVDEAYKQVQKLLTLIKTDVASATSVRINYQDSDGD